MVLRIKELRQRVDMSQQFLASAMGVMPSAVSNWETEVALPRTRQLPDLARVLGVSIDELFEPEARTCPM